MTETPNTDRDKIAPSPCADSPAANDPRTLLMFARRRSLFSNDLASDGSYISWFAKASAIPNFPSSMLFDENLLKSCSSLPPSASPIDRV